MLFDARFSVLIEYRLDGVSADSEAAGDGPIARLLPV